MEHLSTVQKITVIAPPFIFSIIFHEIAHGWIAEKLGDPTARNAGRLTLNPVKHIDLYWSIIMPLLLYFSTSGRFVLGGAKPVPINPHNFKHPRRDMALSSIAGPGANLLIAIACTFLLRVVVPFMENIVPSAAWELVSLPIALMLGSGVIISVALAVFNMIPIPPLDGSRIVYWLLPEKQAALYYRLEPFGFLIVIILLVTGMLGSIIWEAIIYILYFLLGQDILVFLIETLFKG